MAKSIGRYEIRNELGRGGMAVVYRAFDPKLHRDVALKLMDQQLSADPAFAARFEREARTVAALEHNAIVSLYDFGEADGWLYLVMPFLKGGSLKELIADGPLPIQQTTDIVRRIGGALDKAHHNNIIHRDLKPGNILLDEEQEAYLSDFGIIKVAAGDTEYLTETGQTIGTFAYMSPEQVIGEKLDSRSDIYALGLVLFEMLTGGHPYSDATTSGAMAIAQAQKPAPNVRERNSSLPAACQTIIEKALAKDRNDRYATGREMAEALAVALNSGATTATTTTAAAVAPLVIQESDPPAAVADQPTAQPSPVTAPEAEVPQGEVPQGQVPQGEVPQGEVPQSGASERLKKSLLMAATPLPRWAAVLAGLATIVTGIWLAMEGWVYLHDRYGVELDFGLPYMLIIGLLTGATILTTRPADWHWRLAIAILGISAFILASANTQWTLIGLIGIAIGLVQIVQAFRGAGVSLAALGAASIFLSGFVIINFGWIEFSPSFNTGRGLIMILCGIVAIVLAFREGRAASQ